MPSMTHEGMLELFRNRPTLVPELLSSVLGVKLPKYTEARVDSAELTEIKPAQYRADLVVLLLRGKPVYAIVVEVQLSRNDRKRETWPVYLINIRARLRCPVALLVVTPSKSVARWAAQPIETGHPGFALKPIVLGPDAIPLMTDAEAVVRDPELAVLSAMAHRTDRASVKILRLLTGAAAGLDAERQELYLELVAATLGGAAKREFDQMMQIDIQHRSKWTRPFYEQGIKKGIEKGIEKGRTAGRLQGEASALVGFLRARGMKLDADARAKIDGCEDSAQLTAWIERAVTASSVEELFGPVRRRPAKRTPRKRS